MSISFALSGGPLWSLEYYNDTCEKSAVVFKAKVVEKKKYYLDNGKRMDLSKKEEVFKYLKNGGKLTTIYTTATLQVTSLKKGDSLKLGQKIQISWQDPSGSLCPHAENGSLDGKERKWYSSGKTYKILPEKIYKKQGDKYLLDKTKTNH